MTKRARDAEEVEEYKNAILTHAIELITTEGFQNMSMRKIASRCGMSATNLYNYFTNKDEIYINILIQGFKLLYLRLLAGYDEEDDFETQCRNYIRTYLDFGMENNNYYEIMFSTSLPKDNDYAGTSLEELSSIEVDFSNKILDLSIKILSGNKPGNKNEIQKNTVMIWSILHGLISLHNSTLLTYAVEKPEGLYSAIIDDLLEFIRNK